MTLSAIAMDLITGRNKNKIVNHFLLEVNFRLNERIFSGNEDYEKISFLAMKLGKTTFEVEKDLRDMAKSFTAKELAVIEDISNLIANGINKDNIEIIVSLKKYAMRLL